MMGAAFIGSAGVGFKSPDGFGAFPPIQIDHDPKTRRFLVVFVMAPFVL